MVIKAINIVIVVVLMQLTTYFSLDDPMYLNYVRGAYLLTQSIALFTIFIIYLRIQKENDTTELNYTETKVPFSGIEETVNSTVMDHDISKVKEVLQQILIAVGIMAYLHFQMGYLRPLILQVVLGLRTLSTSPLFRVYVLGRPTTGDLERPWKSKMFQKPPKPLPTPKEL
ncbi:inorganic phosphate transporter Pho88 [Chytridium lagenaria]|nr:inorganic phosphate transporter Pho88 [Chytridium lagenaria]